MWDLFLQSQTYHCRPSDLLGIDSDYSAFCLDQAVFIWGSFVRGKLDEVKGKTSESIKKKQDRLLLRLLDTETGSKQFADPADFFGK
jgi:hypothetical protein